jgi:hypothetical protein
MTIKEAETIVLAVVKDVDPGSDRLPGFEIDSHFKTQHAANFVIFTMIWDGNGGGMAVDTFEVNMRTGDVFAGLYCEEYKGRRIARAQAKVRKAIGLDAASYRKYRSGGEYC